MTVAQISNSELEQIQQNESLLKSSSNTSSMNGIAYFLLIFAASFQDGTNSLQAGQANLTESTENLTSSINDAKNTQLESDNDKVSDEADKIAGTGDYSGDDALTGDDLTQAQAQLSEYQQQYSMDDSVYQSALDSMNVITTVNSDTTTSISQNNAQIYQIANYMSQIVSTMVNLISNN